MAESVKSVLYVDYDSIHRSLKASGSPAADRLAQRAAGWVAAIESGRLVVPKGKARIRTQISAAHTREHLDRAIAAFIKVGRELGVVK